MAEIHKAGEGEQALGKALQESPCLSYILERQASRSFILGNFLDY